MTKQKFVIITHLPPRHLDDWTSIAILKRHFPQASILCKHPQEISQEEIQNPNTILVDVGSNYNPELNNFDHHQDREIPCSLLLILKHFEPDLFQPDNLLLKTIDTIDRFGFQKAQAMNLVYPNPEIDRKRKILLNTQITYYTAYIIHNALKSAIQENYSFDTFINHLYEELFHTLELKKALEEYEKEEREFQKKLETIKILTIQNIAIGVSFESLAPNHNQVFSNLKLDMLIEANSMNKLHTSLIVNSQSPKKEQAYLLREFFIKNQEIIFKHPSGFIIVINKDIQSFFSSILLPFYQEG